MTNVPRVWLANLFSYGFRPLFLLMVLYALIGMSVWIGWWSGWWPFPLNRVPQYWHAHEMVMGLAGAAIGGFLLTAVANWTGRAPVSGLPLALLCVFWLAGRFSINAPWLSLLGDMAYWGLLWILVAGQIIGARNRRNYKVLALLATLALADLAFHLAELRWPAWQQQALWLQLWLIIVLINLIGGRVIPAFTGNWLRRQAGGTLPDKELPAGFGRTDLAGGISLAAFALAVIIQAPVGASVALGCLAAALQLWRLARWKTWRTFSDPLVWMLHISWAWIPAGTILWTLSLLGMVPVSAAVHALGVGAIAGMIISVSARAALGHTGRELRSSPLLTGAIVLLNLAALSRIAAAVGSMEPMLSISVVLWLAAFGCFAWRYVPILLVRPE